MADSELAGNWQRFKTWSQARYWRFVLVWGVVFFGGPWGLLMMAFGAWDKGAHLAIFVIPPAAVIAGLTWGSAMWFFAKHRRRLSQ